MVAADKVAKGLWWEAPWGLVVGCTPVSSGCAHCWSKSQHDRFRKRLGREPFNVVVPCEDRLDIPLHRRIPTVYAVWNDLFHEQVPDEFVEKAFAIMAGAPCHRFVLLTKRAIRGYDVLRDGTFPGAMAVWNLQLNQQAFVGGFDWPLPNVVIGTSVENQTAADERIPHLIKTPAAYRMVSYEPALGPLDLRQWLGELRCENDCAWKGWEDELESDVDGNEPHCPECGSNCFVVDNWDLDHAASERMPPVGWLIIGPETGAGRRPCEIEWIRGVAQQVQRAGIPVFIKALPIGKRISKNMNEWPEDLRLRQFPEVLQ